MARKRLSILFISIFLLYLGCGGEGSGGSSETTPQDKTANEPAAKGTDISMYSGTVTGTVNFNGTAPSPRRVRMDAECGGFHSEPVLSENLVVNENNTCKWVFVYVKEGLGDRKFNPPAEPVIFDQEGCQYDPHVFGVQTGQTIKILNSDPLLHNIHALPESNRPFNFGMPKKGDERERAFTKQEIMVKIKCDVHPWMGAYCGVVDHPYFAVTGDDGSFTINNLPPGEYVLEAWHEELGTTTQTVTVGENESKTVDFSIGS